MSFKKILSLLVAAVLLMSCLAGCGDLNDLQKQYQYNHPFENAFQSIEPETVMVTVGTAEITWQQLFHWVFYNTTQYESNNGEITDWNEMLETGKTVAEHILTLALSNALEFSYVEAAAEELEMPVTQSLTEAAKDQMLKDAAQFESYEAFVEAIEAEYSTEEDYLYTKQMSGLYSQIYYTIYGEGGEMLSEEDILEHTAEDGYMMAKMIRLDLYDPNTGDDLPREKKEEQYELCQWILAQLEQCATTEELEERFTEIMVENTADVTGVEAFPDGYLFQEPDFADVVIEAVESLAEYEYSGIVETESAYYVILRLPINVDVIPLSQAAYMNYGYDYSLRYLASVELYNDLVRSWASYYPLEFSPEYEALDLAALLTKD